MRSQTWRDKVDGLKQYHAEFVRLVRGGVETQQTTETNSSSNSNLQAGPQEEPQEQQFTNSTQFCEKISLDMREWD